MCEHSRKVLVIITWRSGGVGRRARLTCVCINFYSAFFLSPHSKVNVVENVKKVIIRLENFSSLTYFTFMAFCMAILYLCLFFVCFLQACQCHMPCNLNTCAYICVVYVCVVMSANSLLAQMKAVHRGRRILLGVNMSWYI